MHELISDEKAAVLLFLILVICIYAFIIEPQNIQITKNSFDLFSSSDDPVKIILLSDFHLSGMDTRQLEDIVKKVNAEEPDIVLIAGDVMDGADREWAVMEPLGSIKAKHGVFAVLGNHDYQRWRCGNPEDNEYADNVETELERNGVTVLRNERMEFDINGERFVLVGLDSYLACKSDYTNATQGIDGTIPTVILAHNQRSMDNVRMSVPSLVLSGHTHCGQVNVPFMTEWMADKFGFGENIGGRAWLDSNTEIYVTCGTVHGSARMFAPPEISVIYLE